MHSCFKSFIRSFSHMRLRTDIRMCRFSLVCRRRHTLVHIYLHHTDTHMLTHTRIHAHTHILTHTHTSTHIHTHVYAQTYLHVYIQAYNQPCAHTIDTSIQTDRLTQTYKHLLPYTHGTSMRPATHTYLHTYQRFAQTHIHNYINKQRIKKDAYVDAYSFP